MTINSLDSLLDQLKQGDSAAAEQVFRTDAPYLRMVVRRQLSRGLRAKFDSMDVVQSVWADLWSGFRERRWSFPDADHLRAFLVKVTQNRFLDRVRQHTPSLEREQPLPADGIDAIADSPTDRPSQLAQAGELWDRIVADCAPAHREVLGLKRQGFSLDEIARQTGFHKSSVRRILYELATRFAPQSSDAGRE